ncbi:amidohydrolase family protein [Aeromicrobium sp. CTD01-1L150]|uniref:amidohydrolase family protein n=1 Tax=Aeromicrobium sp. CTD01-1L150 TaxID=3341830 RepID=UPI0035BFA3D6
MNDLPYRRIAVEEAWAPPMLLDRYRELLASDTTPDPGFASLWGYYSGSSERASALFDRIADVNDSRLAAMDEAGVDVQILSVTCPGVQVFDRELAVPLARDLNDMLAEEIAVTPDRFEGLTAIAPQDPEAAAAEISRGSTDLGLKGVIINSHTQGRYLDDPYFWPIFEAAQAHDTPIYLHPNTPSEQMIRPYLEAGLDGAVFGFAAETGLHLLRIITSGVFDRFPDLKLVVGHLGEALPFWLWRIDFMHQTAVASQRYEAIKPLKLRPSEYFRRNIWITTSGMAWLPATEFVRDVVGADRVMFAWDYPYQWNPREIDTFADADWSTEDKRQFFETTAEHVFGL